MLLVLFIGNSEVFVNEDVFRDGFFVFVFGFEYWVKFLFRRESLF